MLYPFRRSTPSKLKGSISTLLLLSAVSASATTWVWDGSTGNWSTGSNWDLDSVPLSLSATSLVFGGSGLTDYTSTNDLAGTLQLNALTFQSSSAAPISVTGGKLEFLADGATSPKIRQDGTGEVILGTELSGGTLLTFGGTGSGVVRLDSKITNTAGIRFEGASWRLTNPTSTYTGGTVITDGAFVEVSPLSGPLDLQQGTAGHFGIGAGGANRVSINGGTLKFSTTGSTNAAGTGGHIRFLAGGSPSSAFTVRFDGAGGLFDLTNGNIADPNSHAGTIGYFNGTTVQSGGELAIPLFNSTGLAVVRFNGGQLGLSDLANPSSGNWAVETGNALRVSGYGGTAGGPVRIEVSNGALVRAGTAVSAFTMTSPTTYRGVAGGDPTAGPASAINPNTTLTTGRVAFNLTAVTYTNGITFEDSLQVAATGGSSAIVGNMTLAGTASGHPANVVFFGRATGSALTSTVVAPGSGATGQHPLHLGSSSAHLLTIQTGATATFDVRVRADQQHHSGVKLDGTAVLEPGGTLAIGQTLSTFTQIPGSTVATGSVGDVILNGDIEGRGSSAQDALLEIRLPSPDAAGTIANGVPHLLSATAETQFTRPFGGLDARVDHGLIINGSGIGGLRVQTSARPNALFSSTNAVGGLPIPDPVSNLTKIQSYLTVARLSGLTGSGGYLTAAPLGQTWSFPAGGEWGSEVPVGLRVSDHHASGVDVSFGGITAFQHHVVVDSGATLDVGSAPFTFGPSVVTPGLGRLQGAGAVVGTGALTVALGGRVEPGVGGVGKLSVSNLNLQGSLEIEATSMASDLLAVVGGLVLDATSNLTIPGTSVLGPRNYRIATAATRTGTFGTVSGLPGTYAVDYSRPGEIWLRYTAARQVTWTGASNSTWNKTAQNWSGPTAFIDADDVRFDDTVPANRRAVTVADGDVAPYRITVDTASNYSLTSSAGNAITGFGALIKQGTGTLTLSGPASFEGGIMVLGGTLQTTGAEAIPNTGTVQVGAGASLQLGGVETIESLQVNGTVAGASALTVSTLGLHGATSFNVPLTLLGPLTKTGAPLTLAQAVNLGGGERTIDVSAATAPELTIAGVISNGGLVKTGAGTLALANSNVFGGGVNVQAGVVRTDAVGALPDGSAIQVATGATLRLNGFPQSVGPVAIEGAIQTDGAMLSATSLSGTAGSVIINGGTLQVASATNSRFDGVITGTGDLLKSGPAQLELTGSSDYSGGTTIQEGILRISNLSGAGTGAVTVPTGGSLAFTGIMTNPITLSGGTLGSRIIGQAGGLGGELIAATGTTSTIMAADPAEPNVASEVILVGALRGSGDLSIASALGATSADDGPGFRLRGTGASDFSGTINVQNRVKFELQTAVAGPYSPMGTGKIVLAAGTASGGRAGTYSQLNLRNNFTGDTTLGNDVEIIGTGLVNFGPVSTEEVAPANSRIILGNLKIGDGQIAAVNKNASPAQTVQFNSVTLQGGTATFSPATTGFGFGGSANLTLGAIGESQAGSGWIMDGAGVLTLLGGNTYTGSTTLQRGVTRLAGTNALPAATQLTITSGATLDFSNGSGQSFGQTVASLAGGDNGSIITNTGGDATRAFIIHQNTNTEFTGSIQGGLSVVKRGSGTLTLTGNHSYTGTTTVEAGTLSISTEFFQGSIAGEVSVLDGGRFTGAGAVGSVTVSEGGRLEPGTAIGVVTTGGLTLLSGAEVAFDIAGTGVAHDSFDVFGPVSLQGTVALEISLGFDPVDFVDTFTLVINDGADAIGGGGRFSYAGNALDDGELFTVTSGPFSQVFAIEYDGGTGNDIVLQSIPEPGSALLMLGGLAIVAARRRRRG